MKTLMNFLMACAVLGTMSTVAFAGGSGGGGAKDDGTIVVKNNYQGYVMAVVVGTTAPSTVSDFLAQGAKFVQPGDTAEFPVAAGTQSVTAIFIQDNLAGGQETDHISVDVVKKETTNVFGVSPGDLVMDGPE